MRVSYQETVFGYHSLKEINAWKIDPKPKAEKKIIPPLQNILKKPISKQKHILKLKSREPEIIQGKYKVDFHGMAKVPSGKNFIMYD